MTNKNVRIGIIRARHDTAVPVISDADCITMFMVGEYSIFRYWIDTTCNYIDFIDSPMFPWIDISLGVDTSRVKQAETAISVLRAKFPDPEPLAGLDGLIVLTYPGTRVMPNSQAGQPGQPATITVGLDGGAASVAGLPVAILPVMTSNHTFMCHEVGHVLGFKHSFGLDNNGMDWNTSDATIIVGPEYGSPYDLMSSASFGSRWLGTGPFYWASPTFIGPSVSGWPTSIAFSMGPHLSRANLHLHMPQALAGRCIEKDFPQRGKAVYARIMSTSMSTGSCLLILHPPGEPETGIGRVYVEYRTAKGWDAGMDPLGPSLSRVGVVVHSIVDQPNTGPCIWYRGSIPTVSVDRDVSVASTSLVVRVDNISSNGEWIDVSIVTEAVRSVQIVWGYQSDDMIGVVGELQHTKTPCGEPIRKGTFATSTTSQFGVRITGFGGGGEPVAAPPIVTWTVSGVPVTGTNGMINIPFEGSTFAVEYTIDPVIFELQLISRGGERFEVPVIVTVTGDGTSVTANTTFSALGWFDGIHPEDDETLSACIAHIADSYRVAPKLFRKPSSNPPGVPGATMLVRHQAERLWLNKMARFITELPGIDANGRSALGKIVRLQV